MKVRVLLAVKEPALRRRIATHTRRMDVAVYEAKAQELVWDRLLHRPCDMIVVSQSVIPDPQINHIAAAGELPQTPAIVILSAREDMSDQARFRAAGAEAVLYTRVADDVLGDALSAIIHERSAFLAKAVAARRSAARPQLSDFVSASPSMNAFMKTVAQIVHSDTSLLIQGETGVGKERLARAIHGASKRLEGPFISVNCGAVPENLIESELFGHEEGAFTGATRSRRGAFELAHVGTIFLDEISEMPFQLQVKLLHVLQDLEIRPVGAEYTIPVDVRVMAASNKNLLAEVKAKRFRQDLYYRLSVITLTVPPLRERVADIPTLATSFAQEIAVRIGREVTGLSKDALDALCCYSWPGNVRELINVIERAVLLCEGTEITPTYLPEEISGLESLPLLPAGPDAEPPLPEQWLDQPLRAYRDAVVQRCERSYLAGLLTQTQGSVSETASRAGITSRALYGKMKRYGLRKEDFKAPRRPGPSRKAPEKK